MDGLLTCSEGRAVIDIGSLPERAISPADVMMITTEYDVVRHFALYNLKIT